MQGASDAGLIPMFLPGLSVGRAQADVRKLFETAVGIRSSIPSRGLTVVEIMNAIHAGEIRGMYVEGENPAMSDPDLHTRAQALAMLDHLVVQDLFLTETAFHADVVLPASAFAEKIRHLHQHRPARAAGAPEVLSRPAMPGRICGSSRRSPNGMGLDWHYSGPADVFAEMAR